MHHDNLSIPNNANTSLTFDSITSGYGTSFTYSAGAWTNATGQTVYIQVNYHVNYASNTAAGQRQVWIQRNSDSYRFGQGLSSIAAAYPAGDIWLTGSGLFSLASGDSFSIVAYQNIGAALAINSANTATSGLRVTWGQL